MARPIPPGQPPNNPAPPPGPGWGAPAGQPLPGYPQSGTGRGAAGPIAAAALLLAAVVYIARRAWTYAVYDKFFWSDAGLVVSVLIALTAAILLLFSGKPIARMAGGIAAGGLFIPNITSVFGNLDQDLYSGGASPWSHGGWLSVPAALIALAAIAALLVAASSDGGQPGARSWPQQTVPPNPWPQPPMGPGQPPAVYPGQQPPHWHGP